MYLLGLDIGTSAIKASLVDINTKQEIVSVSYPEIEAKIDSPEANWAEQDPELWWKNTQNAILAIKAKCSMELKSVKAIGIAYQMHGLVMINKQKEVLRPAIIWCDSRAVDIGKRAFEQMGIEKTLGQTLNSPGNFTASKLAWVKENEPKIYEQCFKIMLPGDFISMRLTGEINTTITGLSEGIFWDFKNECVSEDILNYFGFNESILPEIREVFSCHGQLTAINAEVLGLSKGISVSYKAGDQANNAFSLNVLNTGEVAATAGTSGVIYAVSKQTNYDPKSRINAFANVNYDFEKCIGNLLCINGTGILYRWVKENFAGHLSYAEMNKLAENVKIGSEGLTILPFGNGAERILENKNIKSHFLDLDFNKHSISHIFRASQEGIVFAMKYGFEIMNGLGVLPKVIRAGNANLFLSNVFGQTLADSLQVPIEIIDSNGAKGAALAAGVGAGLYTSYDQALSNLKIFKTILPNADNKSEVDLAYKNWLGKLRYFLKRNRLGVNTF